MAQRTAATSTLQRIVRPVRSLWDEDRWSVVTVGVASLVALIVWGPTTRPMGDSEGYRLAGRVITDGWSELTERTPGYPLLMWMTGSLREETAALFVVQLLLHAVSVLVVVRIAAGLGLPTPARIAVAVLLVMPAPMVKVAYSGSEALTEILVVVSLWLFVRWWDHRRTSTLVWLGASIGSMAWTRPTFQLLWLPLALVVWWLSRRPSPALALRQGLAVALPAAIMVAGLVAYNGARFDSWGTTPLLGWFLGSRTSTFVQELPADEPLRPLLVAERDRRLLLGPETDAENYLFGIREELAEETGLDGVELDRRITELNVGLILANPFRYSTAVIDSAVSYVQMDAQPAASGPGRPGAWAQSLGHLLLMGAFVAPAVTVPGLALAGRVERRTIGVLGYCVGVAGYSWVVSSLVQTGSPRLRAPTDPLLVLVLVTGWWILIRALRTRRHDRVGPAAPGDMVTR